MGDCISVIACLEAEGVYPNSTHMQGRLLKRYYNVFSNLCNQLGYNEEKMLLLSKYKESYIKFMDKLSEGNEQTVNNINFKCMEH